MAAPLTSPAAQDGRLSLLLRQIRFEGVGINSYEFVDPEGAALPTFEPGAHIDVHVADGVVRQYSLSNDPRERHRYVIAVLRDENGQGGSRSLHSTLRVQDIVSVSWPRNNFALAPEAGKVILLAGGIGITPLKSMVHRLEQSGTDYELHYCAKDLACIAFREFFEGMAESGRAHLHFDGGNPAKGLDIAGLLQERTEGTHLYYCGPGGFMSACAAATAHWPKGSVHFEHFKPPVVQKGEGVAVQEPGSFDVEIASTGQVIHIAADQSIVNGLRDAGVPIATSCESGLCGTCKVRYLSGEVDHRDFILDDGERGEYMTACVSRAHSGLLTLDL